MRLAIECSHGKHVVVSYAQLETVSTTEGQKEVAWRTFFVDKSVDLATVPILTETERNQEMWKAKQALDQNLTQNNSTVLVRLR